MSAVPTANGTHTSSTLWPPSASIETLKYRAHMLKRIRGFFANREVWEVDTPVLSHYGVSDPHIDSIPADFYASGSHQAQTCYLMSSPEYAMKRLLAAGSGSIYQIAKAFRNGEAGKRHNPEFTLLEWYQIDYTLQQLMQEVTDLLDLLLAPTADSLDWHYLSYTQAFKQILAIDPLTCDDATLTQSVQTNINLTQPCELTRDDKLDLLMSHRIEPALPKASVLYDYPASQAALAQTYINKEGQTVAKRFEVFINNMELANGYQELTDPKEQAQRFTQDNQLRHQLDKLSMPGDKRLIAALQQGLPKCCGVALGLDRVMMLALNKQNISEVMAFGFDRA